MEYMMLRCSCREGRAADDRRGGSTCEGLDEPRHDDIEEETTWFPLPQSTADRSCPDLDGLASVTAFLSTRLLFH